jgi:hypothetical protein
MRVRLRHADHLEALPPQRDALSDDGRIRAVARAPCPIREHHDGFPATRGRVGRREQSAERWPRPEHRKVVAGHEQPTRCDGVLHDPNVPHGRQLGEARRIRAQDVVVRRAEQLALHLFAHRGAGAPAQGMERTRIGQVDGLEQVRVDGGKSMPQQDVADCATNVRSEAPQLAAAGDEDPGYLRVHVLVVATKLGPRLATSSRCHACRGGHCCAPCRMRSTRISS